jgi:hypothetical protein
MRGFILVIAVLLTNGGLGWRNSSAQTPSDNQVFGTVKFRIPPGWVRQDLNDAAVLAPSSGAHVAIGFARGVKLGMSYRSGFETVLLRLLKGAQPKIESFPGPGYEILRATIRTDIADGKMRFYVCVAANPFGRLEMITLSTETEPEIQTYWPLFENFRQSLIYLPEAEPAAGANAAPAGFGQAPASSLGARYGTRDPHTCPPAKAPVQTLTAELAKQFFQCREEHQVGGYLYLIENLTLEIGKGRPPIGAMLVELVDLDVDSLVYPIRGSFIRYQCRELNADRRFDGILYNIGKNCSAYDQPKAEGSCYRTTFGEWKCSMMDLVANLNSGRHNLPPPIR